MTKLLIDQAAQDFTDWWATTDGEPSYQETFEAGRRVQLAKRCADCVTPNSCGSDGKCLELYIKSRIAQAQPAKREPLSDEQFVKKMSRMCRNCGTTWGEHTDIECPNGTSNFQEAEITKGQQ
jgi:hypothetical protein